MEVRVHLEIQTVGGVWLQAWRRWARKMNAAVWDQVEEAFMGTKAEAYRNMGFSGVKSLKGWAACLAHDVAPRQPWEDTHPHLSAPQGQD